MSTTKKYVSLSKLSTFLDNLSTKFASLTHTHKLSDISDYTPITIDTELSSTSTNPVQNKVINDELDAIADAMGALELAIDGKADSDHTHDDVYYTETEVDTLVSTLNESIDTKANASDVTTLQELVGDTSVSEQISSSAVLYSETQSLTDEQRAQARANISKFQLDWREVVGYNGTYTLADACIIRGLSAGDIDGMIALTSTVLSQYSALGCLIGCCDRLVGMADIDGNVSTWMPRIISDFNAIKDAGLLSGESLRICQKNSYLDDPFRIFEMNERNGTYTLVAYNAIFESTKATIRYNEDTGVVSVVKEMSNVTDETLSVSHNAADAAVVGAALALKADQTSLDTVSTLVGDTSVSEQIDTAITKSVADWAQTDETAPDYIKNKPDENDALELVMEMGLVSPVAADDGSVYTDENGVMYSL